MEPLRRMCGGLLLAVAIAISPVSAQTLQVSILTEPEDNIEPPLVQVWQHRQGDAPLLLTSQTTFALVLDGLAEAERYLVSVTSDGVTFFSPLIDFTLHPTYHYTPLIRPAVVSAAPPSVQLTISQGEDGLIFSYAMANSLANQPLRLETPLQIPLPEEFSMTTPVDGSLERGVLSLRSVAPSGSTVTIILPELGQLRVPLPPGTKVSTIGSLDYRVHVTAQGILELDARQPGFLFALGALVCLAMGTLLWRTKWRWWILRRVKRLSWLE